jgi:hypothetical protein
MAGTLARVNFQRQEVLPANGRSRAKRAEPAARLRGRCIANLRPCVKNRQENAMAEAGPYGDRQACEVDAASPFDGDEREQLRRFALFGCGIFVLLMVSLVVSAALRADWTLILGLLAAAAGVWVGSLAWRYARPRAVADTPPP